MLFDNVKLTTESNEPIIDDVTESELVAEYLELATEALTDSYTLTEADRITDGLLKQKDLLVSCSNEDMLSICENTYAMSASLLGVSNEDISGMELSSESIGSFIGKVYDSIKLLFKKIANSIKKIVVKVTVIMNNISKKADNLKKALGNAGNPTSNIMTEEESKAFNTYYSGYCGMVGLNKFDTSVPYKQVLLYNKVIPQNISDALKAIDYLNDFVNGNITEFGMLVKKVFGIIKQPKIPSTLDYDKPDEEEYSVLLFNPKGKTVKAIEVLATKNEDIKFKIINIPVNVDLDDSIPVEKLNKLTSNLSIISQQAKNLRTYASKRLSEVDRLSKQLDQLADNKSEGSKITKVMLKMKASVGTNSRALIAGVYLDSILGYDSAIRKAYSFAKTSANYYSINEL